METYLIFKNIAMAVAIFGLFYTLIRYAIAEDRVKKHLNAPHWRRWEEEHRQLELEVKLRAIEMLVLVFLSMTGLFV